MSARIVDIITFVSTAVLLGWMIWHWARRDLTPHFVARWSIAFMFFVLSYILLGFVFTTLRPAPLLDMWTLAPALQFVVALVLFDLAQYVVHILLHRVPLLWRLHAAHHRDREVDALTAFRFHPIEVMLRAAPIFALLVLGFDHGVIAAVVLVAFLWNLVQHLYTGPIEELEVALQGFVAGSIAHSVHHSTAPADRNRNFGLVFSLWDHAFGTWRDPIRRRSAAGLREDGNWDVANDMLVNFGVRSGRSVAPLRTDSPMTEPGIGNDSRSDGEHR